MIIKTPKKIFKTKPGEYPGLVGYTVEYIKIEPNEINKELLYYLRMVIAGAAKTRRKHS